MAEKKTTIEKPNIIICEGVDEVYFVIGMLDRLIKTDIRYDEFYAIDTGGITELKKQLAQIKNMPGYETVRSILILRDTERDPAKAMSDVKKALKANGFCAPNNPGELIESDNIKLACLFFPSLDENIIEGTLEDLCLELLKESELKYVVEEAEKYIENLENKQNQALPRKHKNLVHSALSGTDKYVSFKIGEACMAGAFDINNKRFNTIKKLLLELTR